MGKVYNFDQFINEWISNEPMIGFHLNKMFRSIQKKSKNKIKKSQFSKQTGSDRTHKYTFRHISDYKIFEKILKSYQKNLIDKGIVISYNVSFDGQFSFDDDLNMKYDENIEKTKTFDIYVKSLYSIRVKPPRYIYHITDNKNVDNILKNGLKPKSWDDGNWKSETDLYYPPMIFAITDFSEWHGEQIIRIDTKGLDNKWWRDLNFFTDKREFYFKHAIMTFDPIPPTHLDLIEEDGLYDIKIKN